jgi:NAD(P)-dependent dehydrogenase (short-subunit alcohol dehydrogenase family)
MPKKKFHADKRRKGGVSRLLRFVFSLLTSRAFLMILIVVVAVLLAAPRLSSIKPLPPDSFAPLESFSGRTVVVTGGTAGVGLEAARTLARNGAKLIVTGRAAKRAVAAAASLPGSDHTGLGLDLTSPSSIDAFTAAIRSSVEKLDVLVLNAGMVYGMDFTGPYTVSFPNGKVDNMVASNHLGHFQLLQNLSDLIVKSSTRVVIVSSISHYWGTNASVAPSQLINPTRGVDGKPLPLSPAAFPFLYGATKLLNVLTATRLADMLPASSGASVVLCTPGFSATSIGQSSDRTLSFSSPIKYIPLAFSAEQGSEVLVAAITVRDATKLKDKMLQPYWIYEDAHKIFGHGPLLAAFYNFAQEMLQKLSPGIWAHSVSAAAKDKRLQESVWKWSEEMVRRPTAA